MIRGILFSLAYNLLWLAGYYIFIRSTRTDLMFSGLLFLIAYLAVAYPLKDWLSSRFFVKQKASRAAVRFEKRLHRINRFQQLPSYLGRLVRSWRLHRLRLIVYRPELKILMLDRKGRSRWTHFRRKINTQLKDEIATHRKGRNTHEFPAGLRRTLYARDIRALVPVVFRDDVLGFLAFPRILDKEEMELAELAAARIGIILENEVLKRRIPRSEFMQKEFHVARKIEKYLSSQNLVRAFGYNVRKLEAAWQKKYFSVLYESISSSEEDGRVFFLLARISDSSRRATLLNLFGLQGYFISIAVRCQNVLELAESLQSYLINYENGRLQVDGFIASVDTQGSWDVIFLGTDISMKFDTDWQQPEGQYPLGHSRFNPARRYSSKGAFSILFSIRGFPLLSVAKDLT